MAADGGRCECPRCSSNVDGDGCRRGSARAHRRSAPGAAGTGKPRGGPQHLITLGDKAEPDIQTDGDVVIIEGLVPRYLNNAVARLRVSSMPSLAWWRGGERQEL